MEVKARLQRRFTSSSSEFVAVEIRRAKPLLCSAFLKGKGNAVKQSKLTPPNYDRIDRWLQGDVPVAYDTPAFHKFAEHITVGLDELVARWQSQAAPHADRGVWRADRGRG